MDDLAVTEDRDLPAEKEAVLLTLEDGAAQNSREARLLWMIYVSLFLEQAELTEADLRGFQDADFHALSRLVLEEAGLAAMEVPQADVFTRLVLKERASSGRSLLESNRGHIALRADPVSMFNGQLVESETDVVIDGAGVVFRFVRTYKNQIQSVGPLGCNWDHSYDIHLDDHGDVVFVSTGALARDLFERHPRFGQAGFDYWVPPDGRHAILLSSGSSFVLRGPEGTRHFFEATSGGIRHRLARIEDRFGNALRFLYPSAELQLGAVEINRPDRRVDFEYDSQDRIRGIVDFTGRRWSYEYDDFGDLVRVGRPPTDGPLSGLVTTYEYSSAEQPDPLAHNLVRVIDGDGALLVENEYGTAPGLLSFNRVIRQAQGSGQTLFDYRDVDQSFAGELSEAERPAHLTIEVERTGETVHHVYNRFGHLLRQEQVVRIAGVPTTLAWRYRYNADGALVGAITPGGRATQYLYGREWFLERAGLADGDVPDSDQLTDRERLGFGDLLAVVRRGTPLTALDPAAWTGLFPPVLQPMTGDQVTKQTYEPNLHQVTTRSDPRATLTADPSAQAAPAEHARYADFLQTFRYTAPSGTDYPLPAGAPHPDASALYLTQIDQPSTTDPDGARIAGLRRRFTRYDRAGRLLESVDPRGTVTSFVYHDDASGTRAGHLRRTTIDPGGLDIQTEQEVDPLGRIVAEIAPNARRDGPGTHRQTHTYDALDRIVETVAPAPFPIRTRFAYQASGAVTRVERDLEDEAGQPFAGGLLVDETAYDSQGNPVEKSTGGEPGPRAVRRYRYDGADRLVRVRLPRGNEVWYEYDERSQQTAVVWAACTAEQSATRFVYDEDGFRVGRVDALGRLTAFEYDVLGRLVGSRDATGTVRRTSYDAAGNVTVERVFGRAGLGFELLSRREHVYDEIGRLILVRDNLFDPPLAATDAVGAFLASPGPGVLAETRYFHDSAGDLVRSTDPEGRASLRTYDAAGRLAGETDALGNLTAYTYDPSGNRTRRDVVELVNDPALAATPFTEVFSTDYAHDSLDRVVEVVDPLGSRRRTAYDSRGMAVRSEDALGNVEHRAYDVWGRLVEVRLDRTVTGLGGGPALPPLVTRYEYDDNGNQTATVDALGRRTEAEYDALDRRVRHRYPGGADERLRYDAESNLIENEQPNRLKLGHRYDAENRLIETTVDTAGLEPGLVVEVSGESYAYDGLGRAVEDANDRCTIRRTFDSLGRVVEESTTLRDPSGSGPNPVHTIGRRYSKTGRLARLTYPGGRVVEYGLDALDRVDRIVNLALGAGYPGSPGQLPQRPIASYVHQGHRLGRTVFASGAACLRAFDGGGRTICIDHQDPSGSRIVRLQYLFDAAGNLRLRTRSTPGGSRGERSRYTSAYWLSALAADPTTSIDPRPLAPSRSVDTVPRRGQQAIDALLGPLQDGPLPDWTYDLVGNRTQEAVPGGSVPYVVNPRNQYERIGTRARRHDGNGNLIDDGERRFVYTHRNQLARVVDGATGQTVARFTYDTMGRRVISDLTGDVRHLVWTGNEVIEERAAGTVLAQYVREPIAHRLVEMAGSGTERFALLDGLGTVWALTDPAGAVTALYDYDPFGRPRGTVPPDNPYLHQGRRWDAVLGLYDYRYRTYDPASGRFLQRDAIDGSNLYLYLANNPHNATDPLGLERELSREIFREGLRDELHALDEVIWNGEGMMLTRYQDMQYQNRLSFEQQLAQGDVVRSSFLGALTWYAGRHVIDDPARLLELTETVASAEAVVNPGGGVAAGPRAMRGSGPRRPRGRFGRAKAVAERRADLADMQRIETGIDAVASFRMSKGLPRADRCDRKSSGVILQIQVDDQPVGIKTSPRLKKQISPDAPRERSNFEKQNAITPAHAEGQSLEIIRSQKIRGDKVTLVLDQDFCKSCGQFKGVETMLRQLRDELGYTRAEFVLPTGVEILDLRSLP